MGVDLREVFARPWEGPAVLRLPPWLRWLPVPRRFTFRSEIANVTDSGWDVIDTSTFRGGRSTVRRMRCTVVGPGRLRLDADDMPGGAVIDVRADGFSFSPYVLVTPVVGPLRVRLRYEDDVRLLDDGTMLDVIRLRLGGLLVGTVTLRLRPLTDRPGEPAPWGGVRAGTGGAEIAPGVRRLRGVTRDASRPAR